MKKEIRIFDYFVLLVIFIMFVQINVPKERVQPIIIKDESVPGSGNVSHLLDGLVNIIEFGAIGDGKIDDSEAFIKAKNHIENNGGILFMPKDFVSYISKDIDLFGIKDIRIEGTIKSENSNVNIIIGYNSNVARATNYYINEVENATIRVDGISNGTLTINYADYLKLFCNGDIVEKSFIAYSKFYLGNVKNLEFASEGNKIGWINENKFYGGRLSTLIINGNYSHNNNIFYGTMLENFKAEIINGNNNYFKDCRLEGDIDISFGKDTYNNYFEKSWFSESSDYLKGFLTLGMKITNNGTDNGITSSLDSYYNKETIFELNSRTENFCLDTLKRNNNSLTIKKDYIKLYDSGLVKLDGPIGINLISDKNYFSAFIYAYNENRELITNEQPGFISISGGGFNTTNNYYWFFGANIGSSNLANISINPTENAKYFRYVLNLGHNVEGESFESVKLIKVERNSSHTSINPDYPRKKYISTSFPSEGYWEQGDIVYAKIPKIKEYVGWICIKSGDYDYKEKPLFVGYGAITNQ